MPVRTWAWMTTRRSRRRRRHLRCRGWLRWSLLPMVRQMQLSVPFDVPGGRVATPIRSWGSLWSRQPDCVAWEIQEDPWDARRAVVGAAVVLQVKRCREPSNACGHVSSGYVGLSGCIWRLLDIAPTCIFRDARMAAAFCCVPCGKQSWQCVRLLDFLPLTRNPTWLLTLCQFVLGGLCFCLAQVYGAVSGGFLPITPMLYMLGQCACCTTPSLVPLLVLHACRWDAACLHLAHRGGRPVPLLPSQLLY